MAYRKQQQQQQQHIAASLKTSPVNSVCENISFRIFLEREISLN
jgi:hypothetical protein